MVYDFACKIKNVKNQEAMNNDALRDIVDAVNASHGVTLEFRFVLPSEDQPREFLVKAQASVSSMPALHDKELESAILSFIEYLNEISIQIEGIISEQDGFYNNTQTFKKLFT